MTNKQEGVIKFKLDFKSEDIVTLDMVADLNVWRKKLFELKLIGQDPSLYGGYGYGNISRRLKQAENVFVITGSQTSHLPELKSEHYALVLESHVNENRLLAKGLTKPSSEALTHASIYIADSGINYVFHVHNAAIWEQAKKLKIPKTASDVTYGTPEMALEIQRLFNSGAINSTNILVMGGHEDGVIAFGRTAEQAGQSLINILKKVSWFSK